MSYRLKSEEILMNPTQLTVGTKVLLASGDRAEGVALNTEAESVRVRLGISNGVITGHYQTAKLWLHRWVRRDCTLAWLLVIL
jgi:hypothetical protein